MRLFAAGIDNKIDDSKHRIIVPATESFYVEEISYDVLSLMILTSA